MGLVLVRLRSSVVGACLLCIWFIMKQTNRFVDLAHLPPPWIGFERDEPTCPHTGPASPPHGMVMRVACGMVLIRKCYEIQEELEIRGARPPPAPLWCGAVEHP